MDDEDLLLLANDEAEDDVADRPNETSDASEIVERYIPADVRARFETYSYRNAALILSQAHPVEFEELMEGLRAFSITKHIIREAGGNESKIPKLISAQLRPKGWHETTIQADLLVRLLHSEERRGPRGGKRMERVERELLKAKFLDGHKVDYIKGSVAFDLEWNSKDQTFDRDLYAFSAFSQCGVIDVGVLLTRSAELNPVFKTLGMALDNTGKESKTTVAAKYGASTTWMGKLLYRLNAGRNGSCPVLAFGIRPSCISDLELSS